MKHLTVATGIVVYALAGHAWAKSPNVLIEIDAQGCPIEVKDEEPRNEAGCDKKGVACRHRNESVHWIMKGNTDYAVAFDNGNPFTEDGACLEAKRNPKCSVSADAELRDYLYEVAVEGCAVDPRIVIN